MRQREVIPFREIAATGFGKYPRRAVLGLALFVGQAFIYNGITFNLGTLFSTFFGVSASFVPVFLIVYAAGNFLGPLLLGRLFDTVGRKPMITITYLGSAVVGAVMAALFANGSITSEWTFEAFIVVTFFLASAGASAAYLTVSEIFPMETRALAIAFFYAVGTAVGGITGPLLFGHLIASTSRSQVAIAFYIGSAVMAVGGIAEIFLGVRAEQQPLEDVATPITAEDAEGRGRGERGRRGRGRRRGAGTASGRRARAPHPRAVPQPERVGAHRRAPVPARARAAPSTRRAWPGHGPVPDTSAALERQIELIEQTLDEQGPMERRRLARLVGARYWGPGRFGLALQEAMREGRARRATRSVIAPARHDRRRSRDRCDRRSRPLPAAIRVATVAGRRSGYQDAGIPCAVLAIAAHDTAGQFAWLWHIYLVLTVVVGVLVTAAIVVAAVRFRRRAGRAARDLRSAPRLEAVYLGVIVLIVIGLLAATYRRREPRGRPHDASVPAGGGDRVAVAVAVHLPGVRRPRCRRTTSARCTRSSPTSSCPSAARCCSRSARPTSCTASSSRRCGSSATPTRTPRTGSC